jgi:hypothetical protein
VGVGGAGIGGPGGGAGLGGSGGGGGKGGGEGGAGGKGGGEGGEGGGEGLERLRSEMIWLYLAWSRSSVKWWHRLGAKALAKQKRLTPLAIRAVATATLSSLWFTKAAMPRSWKPGKPRYAIALGDSRPVPMASAWCVMS